MRLIYPLAFCAVLIAAIVHVVLALPHLPDPIASHFNVTGMADAWISKQTFVVFQLILVIVLSPIFVGMPFLMRKIPRALINLPNKDYWLADERIDASARFMHQRMLMLGIVTFVFFMLLNQFVFAANMMESPQLSDQFFYVIIIYIVYVCYWSAVLWLRFKKLPTSDS